MLKIATIGIGNAGNQISELAFSKHGIAGIALNSSQKDLETIKGIPRLVVGDEKGAGKNRDNAKAFLQQHIQSVLGNDSLLKLVMDNDVIFIISSIGGGTGSGMAPIMTDILQRKFSNREGDSIAKKFILVEVYPPIRESLAGQQNAMDYLKEVRTNNSTATYMAYDNNNYSNLSISEMLEKVNNEIVDDMVVLRGDYMLTTKYNSIDEKDMLKILDTPGRLVVYRVSDIKEKDLDEKDFEEMVLEKITKSSAHVELDGDRVVKRLGVITNLSTNLNSKFDTNLNKIKEKIGEPVEAFEHVYVGDKDTNNSISVILSGLSVPNDRIEKMSQRIEEGLKRLAEEQVSSVLDSIDTSSIKELRSNSSLKSEDIDFNDLFGNYK